MGASAGGEGQEHEVMGGDEKGVAGGEPRGETCEQMEMTQGEYEPVNTNVANRYTTTIEVKENKAYSGSTKVI